MPCFRGIDMALVTQTNPEGLSEFPHPEASSVCLIEELNSTASRNESAKAPPLDSDPTCFAKTDPRISVYVPSISGMSYPPLRRSFASLQHRLRHGRDAILDRVLR